MKTTLLLIKFNSRLPFMMPHLTVSFSSTFFYWNALCFYCSNEQAPSSPPALSSSTSMEHFNWLRLAQPSNPAVSLPHPGARLVFLTNYCCCLWWSVTQPAPTELPSPLPFTLHVNMLPHVHTSVRNLWSRAKDWPKNDARSRGSCKTNDC